MSYCNGRNYLFWIFVKVHEMHRIIQNVVKTSDCFVAVWFLRLYIEFVTGRILVMCMFLFGLDRA